MYQAEIDFLVFSDVRGGKQQQQQQKGGGGRVVNRTEQEVLS